jgi:hypothetical protein
VDDQKKPAPAQRPSIRLWLAVLLSVAAVWIIDFVLRPMARHPDRPQK